MALGPGSKYRVTVVGEAVGVRAGIEEADAGNVLDLEDEQQEGGQEETQKDMVVADAMPMPATAVTAVAAPPIRTKVRSPAGEPRSWRSNPKTKATAHPMATRAKRCRSVWNTR
jgi:hypothetical protein